MEFSFNTEIAQIAHCADEAAFVHRIWYLTFNNEANNRNFRDGKYWTYDSVQALAKIFDFWTPKQLRRIIKNCVDLGLIETGQFAGNSFDRRSWYTVTELVKSIYRKGQTDAPVSADAFDRSGKCGEEGPESEFDGIDGSQDGQTAALDVPEGQERDASGQEYREPEGPIRMEEAEPAEIRAGTGKHMCPNGQMDVPEWANACDQSGKSDLPKRENEICPNGQMIKGAIKDLLEDQIEDRDGDATAPSRQKKHSEPERAAYGEFGNVMLSGEEVDKLCSRWDGTQVSQAIESLSAYMASKGRRYKNHYATLLNWLKRDHPPGRPGQLIEEDWV